MATELVTGLMNLAHRPPLLLAPRLVQKTVLGMRSRPTPERNLEVIGQRIKC